MPVPEAPLERTPAGLTPTSPGWFVVNLSDALAMRNERAGTYVGFESREHEFEQFGINVHVVMPGQANGLYHAESEQEAFLVLHGECLVLIEGQERRLGPWDFVHCPPGTLHIFVGAGEGPCAILMVGNRRPDNTIHYPVDELAAQHGASAAVATDSPREAYRDWPSEYAPVPMRWPPD